MIIIGAGLSGLLAATQFQTAQVFEVGLAENVGHKALLRFRSSAVGDAVGVEFRKVRVHKGIWFDGEFVRPSIQLANLYSRKVLGRIDERSVWNMEPVDRFIAPETLMEQLIERVGGRISWNSPYNMASLAQRESFVENPKMEPIVSTTPMSVLVDALELKKHPDFEYSRICVSRFRIARADVFQTIYFPSPTTHMYRASVTGDMLIIESMEEIGHSDFVDVLEAFGIDQVSEPLGASQQRYGKIAPIDDGWRRNFIIQATQRLKVYSLGRFAVWRNILADDVLLDTAVIKKLLKGDAYGAQLTGAR